MKLKYLFNLIMGKTDASKPAKLTFRNIYGVLQAWWRSKKKYMGGFELQSHLWEQIIWRRAEIQHLSPKCWRDGVCKVCGCEVLGKTMEDRACEGACYPPMMNEEEWESFKKLHKIKLFI